MVGAAPDIATHAPSPAEHASRWATRLARTHRENFIVLSPLLPRRLRPAFAAVYAFCRTADDLADNVPPTPEGRAQALADLASFRRDLHACFAGDATHPLFIALRDTARNHHLPRDLFDQLLDAFEQDQHITRYGTLDQVIDYSVRSANPVGHLVLRIGSVEPSGELAAKSDAICTALQLVNHWQDVRRDLIERDRVYLPAADTGLDADWLRAHLDDASRADRDRYRAALADLLARTRTLIAEGADLPRMVPRSIAAPVWLFVEAARRTADAIERAGHATLWHRPTISKPARAAMLARATALRLKGLGTPEPRDA